MSDLELKCINTIRAISADQPESAKSGHPGAPMGCAPMAYALWGHVMKYSAKDPAWIDRDRFVLSNGHACALQYSMLHLTGYGLTIDDLKQFRQVGSKTPGHPESFLTPGVEVCTGPLGQGISNAVGLAIAERHLAAHFNEADMPVFDHHTYVICGDGCLQEGVSGEAGSLAGHLGLGKLIVLYDDNQITIDGSTDLSFSEDVLKRYEAYGWHTQTVSTVETSQVDLMKAIEAAKAETGKPSIIKVKTTIGFGSPAKQGTEKAHGSPLGTEQLSLAKKSYGFPPDEMFHVPEDVKKFFEEASAKADAKRQEWEAMFAKYTEKCPEKAAELSRRMAGKLPEGLLDKLPTFTAGKDKDMATRKFSQGVLTAIGPSMPELVGGSADLTPSNLTNYKDLTDFQKDTPEGRYIRYGVREHAMVSITNGLFAHGALRPYCATFLVFTGYCVGAVRLSALSRFGAIFIMTHDSIGLGEDGPTHQPIETLEMCRAIPNLNVYRPADGNETSAAYKSALEHPETPTLIALSRQTVKGLPGSSVEKGAMGAYAVVECETPALVLISTGAEVQYCVEAAEKLAADGIATRVVSMPCQEVFLKQSTEYQRSVLPGNVPTMAVEASGPHGWHQFSHCSISIGSFGMSGPGGELMTKFGFSTDNVLAKGKELAAFYKGKTVPDLFDRPNFVTAIEH